MGVVCLEPQNREPGPSRPSRRNMPSWVGNLDGASRVCRAAPQRRRLDVLDGRTYAFRCLDEPKDSVGWMHATCVV